MVGLRPRISPVAQDRRGLMAATPRCARCGHRQKDHPYVAVNYAPDATRGSTVVAWTGQMCPNATFTLQPVKPRKKKR